MNTNSSTWDLIQGPGKHYGEHALFNAPNQSSATKILEAHRKSYESVALPIN